jgi:orotidine-5'-phosphate decarboxylase
MPHTPPVFCAIDRPDVDGALALGRGLAGAVGGLKLGLEFTTANGPEGVRRVAGLGLPLFLDLKLHDIPNTVAGAVRAAAGLGGAMLTVHAPGGRAMLRAAADAAKASKVPPTILAVTVLTSLSDADLAEMGIPEAALDHALRLADLALASGCDGIVCSPLEVAAMRERFGRDVLLVVPGVRPAGSAAGDQRRTLTPAEAIAAGADYLVIGRPITAAPDPAAAARAIAAEIASARAA